MGIRPAPWDCIARRGTFLSHLPMELGRSWQGREKSRIPQLRRCRQARSAGARLIKHEADTVEEVIVGCEEGCTGTPLEG